MAQVDRASLGFTPVTTNAKIKLEVPLSGGWYDAMLHVYDITSRTIAFRKTESGYRWIGEQESHHGPGWYQTIDGTFRENIVIEYQTERVNGIPTNQLYIQYTGANTNWSNRELTLAEIQPILAAWETAPLEEWPGYMEGAPDIAPMPLAFFMLAAMLIVCVIGVFLGLVAIGITAVLVAIGILSASVLIGVLRRSVSTGFRALFLQIGGVLGIAFGTFATALYNLIAQTDWRSPLRWTIGILLGLSFGIALAWLFNLGWTRIARALTRRLERNVN